MSRPEYFGIFEPHPNSRGRRTPQVITFVIKGREAAEKFYKSWTHGSTGSATLKRVKKWQLEAFRTTGNKVIGE